jgi:hypothetical protein
MAVLPNVGWNPRWLVEVVHARIKGRERLRVQIARASGATEVGVCSNDSGQVGKALRAVGAYLEVATPNNVALPAAQVK